MCTQISTGYSAGIPYKSGDRRYLVFMMCARKRKRWFFDLFGFGDEEEEKKEKSEAEKEKR